MKKKTRMLIGVVVTIIILIVLGASLFLSAIKGWGDPTGGANRTPDHPYYITTAPLTIKNIAVPKGTKLIYEAHFFKKRQQSKPLNDKKLTRIELPEEKAIDWGGVPVYLIIKFPNPAMKGYSIYADFSQLSGTQKTEFSEMWKSCDDSLGLLIKDENDWSFNLNNIKDIAGCSINYQRSPKEDTQQQRFLNKLFNAMKKVE